MSAGHWAFWVAIAALIAASGKFLDDYHIKASTKSKMRDALIKSFVWLDAHEVPDLGGLILGALQALFRVQRVPLIVATLVVVYWATLSAFYFGREIFGPPNDQSYGNYLLTWIPSDRSAPYWIAFLAVIIVPTLVGLFVMAHQFHRASLTESDPKRLGFLVGGLVLGIAFALSGAILALFGLGGGGYFLEIILLAGAASVALPALLTVSTLLLILVRYGIRLVRFFLLQIFDVASSPAVSPFTYASSLLGVIILLAKVGQTALRP